MNFIDDGTHTWKQVYDEFVLYTKDVTFKSKNKNNIYNDLKIFKEFTYDVIYNKLAPSRKIGNSETQIRDLCKYIITKLLPFVNKNIDELDRLISKNNRVKEVPDEEDYQNALLLQNFYDLEDDLYAMASFRSLIHFAHYMERQDDKSQLVWKYNMDDTMGAIFYYSNQMILDHKFNGLIKQCPTGYGKSKSDCVIIAFCFGYDVNDDIMKIVGNKNLVKPITQSIVKMLKSKNFGKVFPRFGRFEDKNAIFKNCAETDGTFTLADSKKSLSFACYNKETAIDGGRFNKQFYDDVTQSNDRENTNAHAKDVGKYESQWKKRIYDEFSCMRWFTGTAYHREDFLSHIRKSNADAKPLKPDMSTKNRKWNRFVKLNDKGDTVYISIPKLIDLDLGEDKCYCSFPQKYSKEEALKDLHGGDVAIRRFMAMEQQTPLPPESLAFDHAFLRHYGELPQTIKDNNCDSIIIIDPSKKGKDNYAGLIFKRPIDEDLWYLVDCYYKKVSSKVAIPKICERIAYHKVEIIAFEENSVDTYQMEKDMKSQIIGCGYNEFTFKSFYTYVNKEEKISQCRDDIRDMIVFPKEGMYHNDSDMGRALKDITNYSFEFKNEHDDSIDCCAMLTIAVSKNEDNSIEALDLQL